MSGPVRGLLTLLLGIALLLAGGCAHIVRIDPEPARLPVAAQTQRAEAVAYVLSDAQRELVVTTPGGGGDRVSYKLYHDLESALFRVIGNHFARVYSMKSADDAAFLAEKGIRYLFTPQFSSTSSSSSLVTWPPTEFSVTIAVEAKNLQGESLWQDKVTGTGKASYSEFRRDAGLAGKRAAEDAFLKLDAALQQFSPQP